MIFLSEIFGEHGLFYEVGMENFSKAKLLFLNVLEHFFVLALTRAD